MKKLLLKLFLFAAMLYVPLFLAERFYRRQAPKDLNQKVFWVLSHNDQSFDFGVLGSSRALNLVDIDTLEQRGLGRGINLASSGANPAENYLTLYLFLQKNKLKTLFWQVDEYSLHSDSSFSYPFHEYLFLPYLADNEVFEAVRAYNPAKAWLWRYVPMSGFSEFNGIYDLKTIAQPPADISHFAKTKGSIFISRDPKVDLQKPADGYRKKYLVQPLDALYFGKIVELCRQKNIRLIAYTAPRYARTSLFQDNADFYAFIQKQQAAGLSYTDFSNDPMAADTTNFADYTHLNQLGAGRLSVLLAGIAGR